MFPPVRLRTSNEADFTVVQNIHKCSVSIRFWPQRPISLAAVVLQQTRVMVVWGDTWRGQERNGGLDT